MNIKGLIGFVVALIVSIIFIVVISFITKAIYAPIKDNKSGYTLPIPEVVKVSEAPTTQEAPATQETPTTAQTETPAAQETPETPAEPATISLASLLAASDVEAGKKVSRKCSACHNLKQDGKNMVGPMLWGIISHDIGANPDYKYSKIFQELNAQGKVWTYEAMNEFLISPKTFAPKTKMTFSGIKKDKDRADLLAYLQSLSDAPVAFPTE